MTIHEKLIDIIGGKRLRDERIQNTEALNRVYEAYEQGRFRTPLPKLIDQLSEYNYSAVAQLIRQKSASSGFYYGDTEQSRLYQQAEGRQQWLYSPLAQWAVNVWTSYGLGDKVTITLNDPDAQELWDTVWDNSHIFDDDEIHAMSDWVCVDGEQYVVAFCSIADGKVKSFELMDTDEIVEICTNPDNKNQALYYKRQYTDATTLATKTVFYPDYHAFFYDEGKDLEKYKLPENAMTSISDKMDDSNKGTCAVILHVAHNRKDNKSLHGWSILGIAATILDAHKGFIQDRLTIVKNKAMIVRDYTVEGGSRGVTSVTSKLGTGLTSTSGYIDSNPPPIAGSSGVHNAAVTMTDLPMSTGAGDASADNEVISWYALIGTGLFPTTAGLDTSRWATAVAMDKTQAAQWSRYQSFWSCQFRKMVEIVLLADEKWGRGQWEDKGCTVSIDTLNLVDFPGVVTPISQMLGNVNTLKGAGLLDDQAARKIIQTFFKPILLALGAEGTDETLSDELMGILTEEERKALKAEQEKAKQDMAAIQPEEPAPTAESLKYKYGIYQTALDIMREKRMIAEKAKA